ncbi:MAG TPA: hypothetical protein VGA92_05555 [Candidatus Nitrosotenuis sp.]|jgi:uncharacterized membrane protein
MKTLLLAIIISMVVFIGIQTIVPFPYGLIFGIAIPAIIIWRTIKITDVNQHSLLSYRRDDPKSDKEKEQNKEAYRILKKRFLEGEITQEEFDRLREPFGDME